MDETYKISELVGTSKKSIEDAISQAIERTSQTVENLKWFQVVETRGYIENGKVAYYQVVMKIGWAIG